MKDYELSLMIARRDPISGPVVRMWTEMVANGGDPDDDPFRPCEGCNECTCWDHAQTLGGEG